MTYAVIWPDPTIQELARLEAADPDPARVRKAGDWTDYTLRRMPGDVGESRDGNFRVRYETFSAFTSMSTTTTRSFESLPSAQLGVGGSLTPTP